MTGTVLDSCSAGLTPPGLGHVPSFAGADGKAQVGEQFFSPGDEVPFLIWSTSFVRGEWRFCGR